jgi:hypothetical protein
MLHRGIAVSQDHVIRDDQLRETRPAQVPPPFDRGRPSQKWGAVNDMIGEYTKKFKSCIPVDLEYASKFFGRGRYSTATSSTTALIRKNDDPQTAPSDFDGIDESRSVRERAAPHLDCAGGDGRHTRFPRRRRRHG